MPPHVSFARTLLPTITYPKAKGVTVFLFSNHTTDLTCHFSVPAHFSDEVRLTFLLIFFDKDNLLGNAGFYLCRVRALTGAHETH